MSRQRNILSLKSFDGRLFALYVEHLPRSLSRGINSPFAPSDAHIILRDMSSALAYLESECIAHNDIKPGNITYSPQRGAVLIDFGLATSRDERESSGGTPWYVPPEFAYRTESRNASGDIFALGVTMLYVLRKAALPEVYGRGWLIRDVVQPTSEARRQMEAWMAEIATAQNHLARTDLIEGLVYRMVDPDCHARVRATHIVAAIEASELSATTTLR